MRDDNYCDECGEDIGLGSHYHCAYCNGVCGMQGHFDCYEKAHGTNPPHQDSWVVVAFDEHTLFGVCRRGTESVRFHSTSFQSDCSFRWPSVGEFVQIAFSGSGNLLSVHGD